MIALFAKLNIKFCLVTEQNFIETQGEKVKTLFRKIKNNLSSNAEVEDLDIINAENPNLIRRLLSKIRANYSIVFYIDGNTGTNEFSVAKEKLLRINFLDSFINARKGIGFLSHFTKTPIISIICKRNDSTQNELLVELVEFNDFSENRDEYTLRSTKLLYSTLENFIQKHPEQWEGWFYIHKFFELKKDVDFSKNSSIKPLSGLKLNKKKMIIFNATDYELVNFKNNFFFLLDFKNYKVSKITYELYTALNYFIQPKKHTNQKDFSINNVLLEEKAISELLQLNVLVAC